MPTTYEPGVLRPSPSGLPCCLCGASTSSGWRGENSRWCAKSKCKDAATAAARLPSVLHRHRWRCSCSQCSKFHCTHCSSRCSSPLPSPGRRRRCRTTPCRSPSPPGLQCRRLCPRPLPLPSRAPSRCLRRRLCRSRSSVRSPSSRPRAASLSRHSRPFNLRRVQPRARLRGGAGRSATSMATRSRRSRRRSRRARLRTRQPS